MLDLLIQYREARKQTQKMIENCNNENDLKVLNSILKEIEFVIGWLTSGRNPNIKSIEERTVYLVDHQTIEQVVDGNHYIKVSNDEYIDFINDKNNIIYQALKKLSARELEVFLMMRCEKLSDGDVAGLLNIKRSSVNNYLNRAEQKINYFLYEKEIKSKISSLNIDLNIFVYLLRKFNVHVDDSEISLVGEESDEKQIVEYIFSQLSKSESKAYLLFEICKLNILEIKDILNVSETTIRKNITNAKKKLEMYFTDVLPGYNEVTL